MNRPVLEPAADERAVRLGVAAILGSLKGGKAATRRCRSRTRRALARINSGTVAVLAPFNTAEVKEAASEWLVRGCSICRKCGGVTI